MKKALLMLLAIPIMAAFSMHYADAEEMKKDPKPGYLITGVGSFSCATWYLSKSKDDENIVDSWIMGFWTALNIMAPINHHVGGNSDGVGIIEEVKVLCRNHPSMSIQEASGKAYGAMRIANH